MVYLFHRHPYLETKINAATIISVTAFLFGGDEGIRTPVRNRFHWKLSGCSLCFNFASPLSIDDHNRSC